ncbi:MAG: hypothetical protein EXS36_12390 [Pedosphaera sp.]|nr:hypothetical protein [Pedosphaera sp.]
MTKSRRNHWQMAAAGAVIAAMLAATGCSAPPIGQMRRVSQPNMTFSESSVWSYDGRLFTGIESARGSAVGGQNGGCTSCR